MTTKTKPDDVDVIVREIVFNKFPWDIERSLELALVRSFAIPSISSLLVKTGRLIHKTEERVKRTDRLIMDLLRYGLTSSEGKLTAEKIREAHEHYPISNEEYIFVLSTFTLEPIRWMKIFGVRPFTEPEEEAWFSFWYAFGQTMKLTSLPASLNEFKTWVNRFEQKNMYYAPENKQLMEAVINLLQKQLKIPKFFLLNIFSCLFEARTREAIGLKKPSFFFKPVVKVLFALRRKKSRLSGYPVAQT